MINITKEETKEGTRFTMSKTKIDPDKYIDFVRQTTSQEGLDWPTLSSRLTLLDICRAPAYTEENTFHMKRELGDIMWYLAQACMALDISFDEILEMNVEKLSARYPEGAFDVHYSENRKEGDL